MNASEVKCRLSFSQQKLFHISVSQDEKQRSYVAQSRAVLQISYVVASNAWIAAEELYEPKNLLNVSETLTSHPSRLSCPKPFLEFAAFDQVSSRWIDL